MAFLTQSAFGEAATLLVLAAVVDFIGIILRQPLIVSFIAVGMIAGPSALNVVRSDEHINLLSEFGIAALLFLVGIKLNIKSIRSLGAVSLMTGLGQVAFTSIFGFLIGLALGLDAVTSLYVAVALTFSSTIIIVKLLSDKREIGSLHGQIALGFLIVQDLAVVFAMIILATVGIGSGDGHGSGNIFVVLASGIALVGLVVIFVRYAANPLTERLARAPELLVIFAIAQVAMFASIGDFVGLGKEVGGLLAGVSLASIPYWKTIAARLAPLRDFLLLFFFIALGATVELSLLGTQVTAAVVFSLFVLIGNPLIAMGVALGHVNSVALGLVTMVGLVTIAASTSMITYSHQLCTVFEPILGILERKGMPREASGGHHEIHQCDVVIFGLGRFGTAIGMRLKNKGIRVLGVDFNPIAVRRWRSLGLNTEYGDATDLEFVSTLPLSTAKWVVSTIPIHPTGVSYEDTRRTLMQAARSSGFRGRIAVTSHSEVDTKEQLALGADIVLEPFQDAADRAVDLLSGGERLERMSIPDIETEEKAVA